MPRNEAAPFSKLVLTGAKPLSHDSCKCTQTEIHMSTTSAPSINQIKESMRTAWMAGDFGKVAITVSAAAEAFVDRLPVKPGDRVLDIACGTGNSAIPMARRGTIVTGVDIAPNLVLQGRERAATEGLSIAFDEGDAEKLPYADASFDVAVSMFGAMFAPRPELVSAEFARVLRAGGLLAMANWTPASFAGEMFKVMGRHVSPPPGIAPPVLWGDDMAVRQRLAGRFEQIETQPIDIESEMPFPPAGAVAFFRQYFGPTQTAFRRLDAAGQAALAADLEALWASANISPDPANRTRIQNQYLQVTAIRASN
jgi:SAM-dependent methyltransferase